MFKPIKIIVLMLFIGLLLVPTASTAWWNSSWVYNNPASNSVSNISVTFIFGDDFSGYLTKLVVTRTAVISEDKLKLSGNNAWNTNGVIATSTLIVITPEPIYPNPLYIPTLKPYEIDKSHDIWHAKDPSSYIIPDNEWVKYYASQLFVDIDGDIKYKHEKIEWLVDENGTVLQHTYKPFTNNYVYDREQFGTGSFHFLANDDYWANVDYYLTYGLKGDCDEWANTVTSMMLSGEMSVWQGDRLVKQVIPAKSVLGYIGNEKDGWVEYQVDNKTWITSTSKKLNPETNKYQSSTIFIEKNNQFEPVFEFTDIYFRRV